MRPKIMTCHNIGKSLLYNEQKVSVGKAEYLMAGNFLKDPDQMEFAEKLQVFRRRMELNERVSTNLHITLNFHPDDVLTNRQMKAIVRQYMQEIGFGKQPYLVYRHHDAGHPHCHIVTTHVQKNGNPITLYNIGRNQSEKARKMIEEKYGLMTAEQARINREQRQQINGLSPIRYGETSTIAAIANVLEHVLKDYAYTNLEEFNAILRLYNLQACRGREDSQLYQCRGLLYRVLDENGKVIGAPVKASYFDCQPTLDRLEERFSENLGLKLKQQESVAQQVRVSARFAHDLKELEIRLRENGLRVTLVRDAKGDCRSVHYTDTRNGCVIDGNAAGQWGDKEYIQGLIQVEKERRMRPETEEVQQQRLRQRLRGL